MKLNQLLIQVRDTKISAAFYVALGCEIIVFGDDYMRLLDPSGQTTFSLSKVDKVKDSQAITLYFELDTPEALSKMVASMQNSGLNISKPEDQRWLWREAELSDPDGYKIKLYHAGENRLYPPWGIKQNQAQTQE